MLESLDLCLLLYHTTRGIFICYRLGEREGGREGGREGWMEGGREAGGIIIILYCKRVYSQKLGLPCFGSF